MKVLHFKTVDGNVDMKVDIIGTGNGANATIMDIEYFVTNTSLIKPNQDDTINAFLMAHPVFAGIKQLVSSRADLKAVAVNNNFTLIEYDQGSSTTLNSSTTTTTTTHTTTTTSSSTTTTTTTP